jgi:biotin carboxyl carrier protein
MAKVTIGGRTYDVEVKGEVVVVDGHEFTVTMREESGYTTVKAGDQQYRIQLPKEEERVPGLTAQVDYRPVVVNWEGSLSSAPVRVARAASTAPIEAPKTATKGGITAQIAGRVLSLKVKVGDVVKAGDVLLLLEAMKMENEIKARTDGTVTALPVPEGGRVAEGDVLAVVE